MDRKLKEKLGDVVQAALKRLLCEKHLYQYVEVDLALLDPTARLLKAEFVKTAMFSSPGASQLTVNPERTIVSYGNMPWLFVGGTITGASHALVEFELPSINTFCAVCDARPPFNPVPLMCSFVVHNELKQDQWYTLAYECQQCKGTPVRFLVRREGLKLRLVGRDPIEAVPAPKELPEPSSKFFGKAIMAHNTGQALAGIFFLRTFIEQFWRSVPSVQAVIKEKPRATGDEQGAAYQATLLAPVRDGFPSLRDIYGKLSAAMHDAKGDAALFEECRGKILHHFEGRKAYRL